MRTLTRRTAAVAAAGVVAITAGISSLNGAFAQESTAASSADKPAASAQPSFDREKGVVLEGRGALDGVPFSVTVYDNSLHGSSVQVVLGDPDDNRFGYAEQATPYVVDGELHVTVDVDGKPLALDGTVVANGDPVKIHERFDDAGERHTVKGVNIPLTAHVEASYGDAQAPVLFDPAFAFDLRTKKSAL